jgi:hypothetical protein
MGERMLELSTLPAVIQSFAVGTETCARRDQAGAVSLTFSAAMGLLRDVANR